LNNNSFDRRVFDLIESGMFPSASTMEMIAVTNRTVWGLSAGAVLLALSLAGGIAHAQQPGAPAPAAAPKAEAKKVEPAKKAEAPKAAAPAKKAPAKSACVGLDQNACTAAAVECNWIAETAITKGKQAGTKRAAHCAKKPAKKAEAKKAEPKAAAAKAAAPAAPPKAAPAAPKAPAEKKQ
jgi:hypothetical protein